MSIGIDFAFDAKEWLRQLDDWVRYCEAVQVESVTRGEEFAKGIRFMQGKQLQRVSAGDAERYGQLICDFLRTITPVDSYEHIPERAHKGKTRASWFFETKAVRGNRDATRLIIRNKEIQAAFLEFGTTPHNILARRAPYLVFRGTNEWAGQWVRIKQVKHPGQKPLGLVRRAVRKIVYKSIENLEVFADLGSGKYRVQFRVG